MDEKDDFKKSYASKMKTKSKYMQHVELMEKYKLYKEKYIDTYENVVTYGDILKKEHKYGHKRKWLLI